MTYTNVKPEKLMEALRASEALISVSTPKGSIRDEIIFATANGYKLSEKDMKDPSDPGGIMDMVAVYFFQKSH